MAIQLLQHWVTSSLIAALALVAGSLLIECILEIRDVARYTPGQTFAKVGRARIRYRILGADRPGATVVILAGIGGSIEQAEEFQSALSSAVPSLTYDRAGYGFSRGSTAHSAKDQADELAALLDTLGIEKPIVLVSYSDSDQIARVFVGRYPAKVASMYLVDPWTPEFYVISPHDPRRMFVRYVLTTLVKSSLGYPRLMQRLHGSQGTGSSVERRANAILARRSHYWAQTREWWLTLASARQTREAPIPATVPVETVYPRPAADPISQWMMQLRVEVFARYPMSRLVEVQRIKHELLVKPGPVFDLMVARIQQLSCLGAR